MSGTIIREKRQCVCYWPLWEIDVKHNSFQIIAGGRVVPTGLFDAIDTAHQRFC